MADGGKTRQQLDESLIQYLQSWGLKRFSDEASYHEWQSATLPSHDLQALQSLVERRHGGENEEADIQFYDLLAKLPLLPVLYSQRFDYYLKIGTLLSQRLFSAKRVLDFGCGVGILTCFYAQEHPDVEFLGIDRSERSIEMAQAEARKRHLSNVQFRVATGAILPSDGLYDCILSTQVLFQSEQEPGLPSLNWQTFEREQDLGRQRELEGRTGLATRLDAVLLALSPDGRLICFEKTWNLGRRIYFQRAMCRRRLFPVVDSVPCSFQELGEWRMDGPIYEVSRHEVPGVSQWNEAPYQSHGETLYRCAGLRARRMGEALGVKHPRQTARGEHGIYGSWLFEIGVWEETLSWGWLETESGFSGLVLGSYEEGQIIVQLLEKVRNLPESEFEEFLHNSWSVCLDDSPNDYIPGYENHTSSAQAIFVRLPQKTIQQEATFTDGHGKEMHIETGSTKGLHYLYWANTYDQRQLVLMDETGRKMLHEYYQESLEAAQGNA